ELIGWMRPEDNGFTAIDLLGRALTTPTDWLAAESALEEVGLRYLAEPFTLELASGEQVRVRIVEASPRAITVKTEAFGVVGGPAIPLPFPAPPELRPVS